MASTGKRLAAPLAAALLASALGAAPRQTDEDAPSARPAAQRERSVYARFAGGTEPPSGTSWLTVLEQGQPREVVAADPVDLDQTPWEVVVYVDLPLATVAGLQLLEDILSPRLGDLAAVAEVQIIAAETIPRPLGPASRRTDEIGLQLRSLLTSDRVGKLAELQHRIRESIDGEGDAAVRRRRLLEHFFEDQELRDWQQQSLEDFVLGILPDQGSRSDRPRALFLLRDALGPAAADFVRELHGRRPDPLLEHRLYNTETERQRAFARTLAALGWHVFPIRPTTGDKGGRLPGPDDELATATGGTVLSQPAEADRVLEELARALEVRYLSPAINGEPGPLDLRTSDPRIRLRAPRWSTGTAPDQLALIHARRLLEYEDAGTLAVGAAIVGELAGTATMETAVSLADLAASAPDADSTAPLTSDLLRITVVSERLDREPEVERLRGSGLTLTGNRWVLRSPLATPDDLHRVVVVVEDLRTGEWGAALAEEADQSPFDAEDDTVVETAALDPPAVDGNLRPKVTTGGREHLTRGRQPALIGEPPRPRSTRRPTVLKLVPPRGSPLTGQQRFQTLLSTDSIHRVEFYLDGELVAEDDKRPFEARIDLGAEVRKHEIRIVAFSRGGAELGEDRVQVNRPRSRLGITLTSVEPVSGSQDVSAVAELNLPRGSALDRVEFYRNEILAATITRPPFTTRLPGPARLDADFVRVVAYLTDGSFVEDVRLLGDETAGERVDVNLVEIYAVVTDQEGQPVHDLELEDFTVRQGRSEIRIDRFAIADEVPLVLGLVVDSSESMWPIMPDTRKAAARFLGDTVTSIDRAFVVDFDDRPRLLHPTSARVFDLIASLGRLEASGATALYDSILFAMLQFEEGLGRKAIVLLTDGDDYRSRFSYNRVQRTAARAGIPIYFIALEGFEGGKTRFRKDDLEVIAKDSGGRVFYVTSMDQVVVAYRQIGEELRSQYILAFTTERVLSDEEVAKIRVEVDKRGLDVRSVIGRDR